MQGAPKVIVSCVAASLAVTSLAAATVPTETTVIHAGHLIDGISAEEFGPSSIVIDGDRIVSVQPGFVTPAGARVVDLEHSTVLPGLINLHAHLTDSQIGSNPLDDAFTVTPEERVLFSTMPARAALDAGFTTVRDVGSSGVEAIALKHAIEAGWIDGPRMWVSGPILGPTGGHGDQHSGLDPEISDPAWELAIADGPDAFVKAVRTLKRDGADLIKIATSGGTGSRGDSPQNTVMSADEVRAVVTTAHSLGMKVAVHAQNKQAVDVAVVNGVDSIEHGAGADEASYRLMRDHHTVLVPTMLIVKKLQEQIASQPQTLNRGTAQKVLAIIAGKSQRTCAAFRSGVTLGFGTDVTVTYSKTPLSSFPTGKDVSAQEFKLLVDACLPPMEAIFTATRNAAALIGATDDIGAVAKGRYADIIAVDGDPLVDITVLERPRFVMKGGTIYKGAATALTAASTL